MFVIIRGLDDAVRGDSREESRTVRFLLVVFHSAREHLHVLCYEDD